MNPKHMKSRTLFTLSALAVAVSAVAQETDQNNSQLEEVVVTGSSIERSAFDTPLTVNRLGEDDLKKVSFSSQADILATIPGLKAEGGGGEVATNLQIRGLPSTGQFQFTPLNYDGVPLFSTFGLNSSAFDFYGRNDLGIERLEFVKGGVSNLFGPGSVAGIINYISKTGSEEAEGTFQTEWAEEGRFRGDFAMSGPLSDDTFYAISGFYRYDEGPIKTGNVTDGYQLRGNIKHDFDDGSGSFTVHGQYIDDRVQFFLPVVLDSSSLERINGNDGSELFSHNTSHISGARVNTPEGIFEYDGAADGFETSGGAVYAILDKDLENDWSVNIKAKYSNYESSSNFFNAGDGRINFPETQAQFLSGRAELAGINLADASFTYADNGQALDPNALLFANRFNQRNRPATDATFEANIAKSFEKGNWTHNITAGTFFSRAEALNVQRTVRYLAELNDNARLINLVVNDPTGSINGTAGQVVYAFNGITDAVTGYANQNRQQVRQAFYIADQIESDDWAIDFGLRWETTDVTNIVERTGSFAENNAGGASAASGLSNVTFGTGAFQRGNVSTNELAASFGALYRLNDTTNVYTSLSHGFFFPQAQGIQFNPQTGVPGPYEAEIIDMIEVGAKYQDGPFSGEIALYNVELSDREQVQFVNDPGGSGALIAQVTSLSTSATGIEANGTYDVSDSLSVNANFIVQDHEVSKSESNPALVGKELQRKPNFVANLSADYAQGPFDLSVYLNHQGANFADNANLTELDAFQYINLNAGYSIDLGGDETLRLGLSVFNLTDEQGLQEGNPRLGSGTTFNQYAQGRPILPRRVTFKATYSF